MRFLLAALVAAAGWFAFTRRGFRSDEPAPQPCQNGDEHASHTARSNGIAAQGQPDRTIAPVGPNHRQRTDDTQHASDERHRRGESRYWAVTGAAAVVATGATIAAAVFAAGAYFAAREQTSIARNAYLATTRAWFDVDVDLSDISLDWRDGQEVVMYVKIKGTNNGNSPAIDASLSSRLIVDRGIWSDPLRTIVEDSCTKWHPVNGGDIVFMKEPIEHYGPVSIPWYEIKSYLNNFVEVDGVEKVERPVTSVPFKLVACAMYRIEGDAGWHYTARIFQLVRLDEADGTRASHRLRIGEDLENGRLTLLRENIGAYAN